MRATRTRVLSLIGALALLAAQTQHARSEQPLPMKPPDDSNISYQGTGAKQPPKPQAPEVKAPPVVWPRLDPGAVLCRSQEDLQRRAANLRGEVRWAKPAPKVGPSVDGCRTLSYSSKISLPEPHWGMTGTPRP